MEFNSNPTPTQAVTGPGAVRETDEITYDTDIDGTGCALGSISDLERALGEQAQTINDLEYRLEQSKARRRGLEKELKVREEITTSCNSEIRDARKQLVNAADELRSLARTCLDLRAELDRAETQARQSGQNSSDKDRRISELKHRLNMARVELSDLRCYIDVRKKNWSQHEEELEAQHAEIARLREAGEALREEYEREVRQVRFELGTAQQTIADQETVNEQLSSDLFDHQGYRQALESHLGDVEKENEKTIRGLKRQLDKARNRAEDYERKLRVKDGAIEVPVNELSGSNEKPGICDDLEKALRKIDGYRPHESNAGQKRDRVTRQLIGSADGKELRFPLFRNRLTIGRTPYNDIQLDLRFVSRRHAVVATDNNRTRVIDWGSRNGVYVNRKRVTEKILSSGDVITIGLTSLRYEERLKR